MTEIIHLAHSISRKHGGYVHVRAYVLRDTWKHTQVIANADTLAEAEALVMNKIREDYLRYNLPQPTAMVNAGRVSAVMVDHWNF